MSIQNAIQNANQLALSCFEKLYLSYDAEKGWEVRTLNCFQRALRWLFGMYPETHLATIQSRYRQVVWTLDLNQMVNLSAIKANDMALKIYLHSLYEVDAENINRIAIVNESGYLRFRGLTPDQITIENCNKAMGRLRALADILEDLPARHLLPTKIKMLGAQACRFYREHCSSEHSHNTALAYLVREYAYLQGISIELAETKLEEKRWQNSKNRN
jgi:hypothetical protein